MCIAAAPLAMAAMAASTAASAYGAYTQGQTSNRIAQANAQQAQITAQTQQQQGELAAQQAQRQAAMAQGAARARLAANGVDTSVGTAGALQAQNDFFGEMNANTARYNAQLGMWSSQQQANNFTAEGSAAATQGDIGAFGTVLGGAGQVAGRWYSYKNPQQYPFYGG